MEHEQSSQGSASPLPSPRDNAADGTEPMSPFYTFLHSKVCDCACLFVSLLVRGFLSLICPGPAGAQLVQRVNVLADAL